RPVARRIRERLAEDPVRRLVDAGREVPALAENLRPDVEPAGARALDERIEGAKTRRRLDPVRAARVAEGPHEVVDLDERLAGDLLDRLERGARAGGIALEQKTCGAGLDEDDV